MVELAYMPKAGNIQWRWQKTYDPSSKEPFALSRTKVDNFLECPRCFYLDRRLGVQKPKMPAFTLNVAVDALMKKEFDVYRAKGEAHPLMNKYGVKARPVPHEELEEWRENFAGLSWHDEARNLVFTGAIDDLWQNDEGEYIIVDYKATSKDTEITLDDKWKERYKRQMEFYQWLMRKRGFKVSDTGYFVYVNGRADKEAFDAKLEFDVQIIPYKGSDAWVDDAVAGVYQCLRSSEVPESAPDCEYCVYRMGAERALKAADTPPPKARASLF